MLVHCPNTNSILVTAAVNFQSIWLNQTSSLHMKICQIWQMWKSETDSHTLFVCMKASGFLQRLPIYLLVSVCWFQWLCTSFSVFMQFHLQSILSGVILYMRWSYLCTVDRCVCYTYSICMKLKHACIKKNVVSTCKRCSLSTRWSADQQRAEAPKTLHVNFTLFFFVKWYASFPRLGIAWGAGRSVSGYKWQQIFMLSHCDICLHK